MYRNEPSPRRATAGMTALEVLVVIAIIGFLSVLAFNSWIQERNTMRLRSTATEIAQLMQKARIHAIKLNRQTDVFVETSDSVVNTYTGEDPDTGDEEEFEFNLPFTYIVARDSEGVLVGRVNLGFQEFEAARRPVVVFAGPANSAGVTFPRGEISYSSTGAVRSGDIPGAFLISDQKTLEYDPGSEEYKYETLTCENVLEVVVNDLGGIPQIRKYIFASGPMLDTPGGRQDCNPGAGGEFKVQAFNTVKKRSSWQWY